MYNIKFYIHITYPIGSNLTHLWPNWVVQLLWCPPPPLHRFNPLILHTATLHNFAYEAFVLVTLENNAPSWQLWHGGGEGIRCEPRDTVSVAITDRYQQTQQLTSHTRQGQEILVGLMNWTVLCKYSFPARCDGGCVLNYILSCIKPVTFGRVPAVSPDGPHPISRVTSALSAIQTSTL